MRYFKFRWNWKPGDDEVEPWGNSWWYYEFGGPKNSILRQIVLYDNGFRVRYSLNHLRDDYGELFLDVQLDEFDETDLKQGEEIGQAEFVAVWQTGPWTNEMGRPKP